MHGSPDRRLSPVAISAPSGPAFSGTGHRLSTLLMWLDAGLLEKFLQFFHSSTPHTPSLSICSLSDL